MHSACVDTPAIRAFRTRCGPLHSARVEGKDAAPASSAPAAGDAVPEASTPAGPATKPGFLKRTWDYVKKEAQHYKEGTILLYQDVRTAVPLLQRVLLGYTLSRREHNLLVRVVADMTRLVPFAFFVLVPFMEFLLPIALRLFPQMLPSTFETKFQKEEDLKRKLKAKIELAKVMHDAVESMAEEWAAKQAKKRAKLGPEDHVDDSGANRVSEAEELREIMRQIKSGEPVEASLIVKFSRLFRDELTLSNLNRTQLELLCTNMGIRPLGTNALLRWQLRNRIRKIKNDDRMIVFEGLGSLRDDELEQACADRGMRAGDVEPEHMRKQLERWLELSQEQAVPITLLILANGQPATKAKATAAAQQLHPEEEAAKAKAAAEGAAAAATHSAQQRTGTLAPQAVDAQAGAQTGVPAPSEAAAEAAVREAREQVGPAEGELPAELQSTLSEMSEGLVDAALREREAASKSELGEELSVDEKVAELEREMRRIEEEYARAQHEAGGGGAELEAPKEGGEGAGQAQECPVQTLHDVVEAAELLASESAVASEKSDVQQLDDLRQAALRIAEAAREDAAIGRMDRRLEMLISDLKEQVEVVDQTIGETMHILDLDGDGIISVQELTEAVQVLKGKPLEAQWEAILDRVDPDHDGRIEKAQLRKIVREIDEERKLEEERERQEELAERERQEELAKRERESADTGGGEAAEGGAAVRSSATAAAGADAGGSSRNRSSTC